MKIQMVYEINNTYMEIDGSEVETGEDYRQKMLELNDIKSILSPEFRTVNNEKKVYIDVSGKESLLNRFNTRLADRQEVRALMEGIFIATENAAKYLISENEIVFRPELIFKNPVSKAYEFLALPLKEGATGKEGMKELLQFMMAHLDNSDEKLVNAVYGLHEMYQNETMSFAVAFEFFSETLKEGSTEPQQPEERDDGFTENILWDVPRYIPGIKEIAALAMCFAGLSLLGMNLYMSMLNA